MSKKSKLQLILVNLYLFSKSLKNRDVTCFAKIFGCKGHVGYNALRLSDDMSQDVAEIIFQIASVETNEDINDETFDRFMREIVYMVERTFHEQREVIEYLIRERDRLLQDDTNDVKDRWDSVVNSIRETCISLSSQPKDIDLSQVGRLPIQLFEPNVSDDETSGRQPHNGADDGNETFIVVNGPPHEANEDQRNLSDNSNLHESIHQLYSGTPSDTEPEEAKETNNILTNTLSYEAIKVKNEEEETSELALQIQSLIHIEEPIAKESSQENCIEGKPPVYPRRRQRHFSEGDARPAEMSMPEKDAELHNVSRIYACQDTPAIKTSVNGDSSSDVIPRISTSLRKTAGQISNRTRRVSEAEPMITEEKCTGTEDTLEEEIWQIQPCIPCYTNFANTMECRTTEAKLSLPTRRLSSTLFQRSISEDLSKSNDLQKRVYASTKKETDTVSGKRKRLFSKSDDITTEEPVTSQRDTSVKYIRKMHSLLEHTIVKFPRKLFQRSISEDLSLKPICACPGACACPNERDE